MKKQTKLFFDEINNVDERWLHELAKFVEKIKLKILRRAEGKLNVDVSDFFVSFRKEEQNG